VSIVGTEEERRGVLGSESEPYSDKERQKENVRVRKWTLFGQRKTEKGSV
jgi:hypothetical protein